MVLDFYIQFFFAVVYSMVKEYIGVYYGGLCTNLIQGSGCEESVNGINFAIRLKIQISFLRNSKDPMFIQKDLDVYTQST